MNVFEIIHRKVDVIRKRFRCFAARCDIDKRQNHRTAIKVMTRRARDSSSFIAKQVRIELRRFVEIGNLKNDSEERGCVSHRCPCCCFSYQAIAYRPRRGSAPPEITLVFTSYMITVGEEPVPHGGWVVTLWPRELSCLITSAGTRDSTLSTPGRNS